MIQRPSSLDQLPEVFAQLQRMRQSQPVAYDEATESWHLFGYAEVEQALTDVLHFAAGAPHHAPFPHTLAGSDLDPQRHSLLRGMLAQALAPHALKQLAPAIRARVQTVLDRHRATGAMDVIDDLAVPLACSLLAEFLGIPATLQLDLEQWIQACTSSSHEEQVSQASRELEAALLDALAHRRRHPQQDLLSRLLLAEIGGVCLSDRDIVWCCHALLMCGQATIPHLLGNAVWCLLTHPEVIARLRHEPAPIYSTMDEVLRYLPPVWIVQRTTCSVVILGAQTLPAQARVWAWIASANRDARHFARPDQFDIDRIPNRHVSFGGDGVHACVGAGLGRLITRITLELLSQQFTDIELPPGHVGAVVGTPTLFGVNQLPITFRPMPRASHPL